HQRHALLQHQPQHVSFLCSKSHPYAAFASPSRNRVRHHTVQTDSGQQQSQQPKDAQQRRAHSRGKKRSGQYVIERLKTGHRKIAIQRLYFLSNRRRYARGLAGCANVQGHSGFVILRERNIDRRTRVLAESAILAVANEAYDLSERPARTAKAHAFADHLFIFEVTPGERFVRNRNQGRGLVVLGGEAAAGEQPYTHRGKVFLCYDVCVHRVGIIILTAAFAAARVIGTLPAFNQETACAAAAAHRHYSSQRGRFDAGKRLHSLDYLPVELLALWLGVSQQIDVEIGIQNLRGIESRID